MQKKTAQLWAEQDRHPGDRLRLFSALANWVDGERVLYPGSFVDVAASFAFADVTYVDSDKRAAAFFADEDGVAELIAEHQVDDDERSAHFISADYREPLPVKPGSVDVLVSLYAGFVSDHCTDYLRIGGTLLVNPSHGDVALVSLDERYELSAVVKSSPNGYGIDATNLEGYLLPKKPQDLSADDIRALGRGIAYTRSPFAYLFERVS